MQATATAPETAPEAPVLDIPLKEMLLDAIEGVGLPTLGIALASEQHNLAYLITSHGDKKFIWNRSQLAKISEEQLQALYYNLKVAQHGS